MTVDLTPSDVPPARPWDPIPAGYRLGREDVRRIRLRHRGYRLLLSTISTVLLMQPLARPWSWLKPVMAIGQTLVMMLFLTRYSSLGPANGCSMAWASSRS